MKNIKVLILPKFEIGTMDSKEIGEAKFFYEEYFKDSEKYNIKGCPNMLYVKDNLAMMVVGEGKANVAMSLSILFSDARFNFDEAYVISTGCCGSATVDTVMGDVFVVTDVCDLDFGHTADIRDIFKESKTFGEEERRTPTWFYDNAFDAYGHFRLNETLVDKIYESTKNIKLESTEKTRKFMEYTFDNADWIKREPKVIKGTTVTSDNYWKGYYGENNARLVAKTYNCSSPYVSSEMEDSAIAQVMYRFNRLDRLIVTRVSVNFDVFVKGSSPQALWGYNLDAVDLLISDNSEETADIFVTAMQNNFKVNKVIIDMLLQ